MSDLSFMERSHLEKLFGMSGGYVLNFSNRAFQDFIADATRKDIYDDKYSDSGPSKACRLRQFWKVEANVVVGELTRKMIEFAATIAGTDEDLLRQATKIATRLLNSSPVPELDAITAINDDRTFEALAKMVREAIDNNEPECGLDRLHTFVVKYISEICKRNGISIDRDKPLHSLFGEYVKHLRKNGGFETEMTERILKSCISTLESFNHVRNQHSFAHDNPILNYDESLLIYNHVCAALRFIASVEKSSDAVKDRKSPLKNEDDVSPF